MWVLVPVIGLLIGVGDTRRLSTLGQAFLLDHAAIYMTAMLPPRSAVLTGATPRAPILLEVRFCLRPAG
jgi:hypothetical protein